MFVGDMYMKYRESDILIYIDVLRRIMNIFYGPFLTVYFIKVSINSIIPISIYNIISYFILGIMSLILGFIIRSKYQLETFRVGVVLNFIYILTIMILESDIVNYLWLIAILFGVSTGLYYYPHNMLSGIKVKNKDRDSYELKKKIYISIFEIITPLVLGTFITTVNFYFTASIILLLSGMQIILSFFIKPFKIKEDKFTPIKAFKKFIKNKNIVNIFFIDFFRGLTISDSVLQVILTILVFNSFKTDLNLGIISSISTGLLILISYLYLNKVRDKNNKFILYSFVIIPIVSLFLLVCFTNDITLIIYYLCYNGFVGVLLLISTIKIYNASNLRIVRNGNLVEYWSIREAFQGMGRVVGYLLLLIVGVLGGVSYLYYLMIIITLSIFLLAYFLRKV